jgi:hypothetical protein
MTVARTANGGFQHHGCLTAKATRSEFPGARSTLARMWLRRRFDAMMNAPLPPTATAPAICELGTILTGDGGCWKDNGQNLNFGTTPAKVELGLP